MKRVYVNFKNDIPHSKFMTGHYEKEISLPFILLDDDSKGLNLGSDKKLCQAPDDYDIPWTGTHNDAHIEHIPNGAAFIFPAEIVTDEPEFT